MDYKKEKIYGLQDKELGYPAPEHPADGWPHIKEERERIRKELGMKAIQHRDLGDEANNE